MKRIFKIIGLMSLVALIGIIAIFGLYWWIESPHPSESNVRAWEKNYRTNVTDNFSEFQGHWLSADIAAYIYSYNHTSDSTQTHQKDIIRSLRDFSIYSQTDNLLVLRKPVTYSSPRGFDEWRFLFDADSRIVTVLFANLDSEMECADKLANKALRFHQKRKDAEHLGPYSSTRGRVAETVKVSVRR